MGCTPSSQSSPTKTGLKFTCELNEDETPFNLDWPNKDSEDRLLLPSGLVQLNAKANKVDANLKVQKSTLKFGPMRLSMPSIKLLLVFEKPEAQSDTLRWASERLGYHVTLVHNSADALENYRQNRHHVIFIDARQPNHLDPLSICRSLRNIKGSQYVSIIGVVKRSWIEKDETALLSLLKVGFNKCFVETYSSELCLNELIQLEYNDITSLIKLRSVSSLFSALDYCKDGIILTGPNQEIEFLNTTIERLLGYKVDELIGKNAQELHRVDLIKNDVFENINTTIHKGKKWEGTLLHRRKSGECVPIWSRIIPVEIYDGVLERYIYIKEYPYYSIDRMFSPEGDIVSYNYGSGKSNKNASCDVKSICSEVGLNRRNSFAKFHAMTIEAPITKVINILMATQENSPVFVAQTLAQVVEMLRTTELYSPSFTGFNTSKTDDQLTNDLFTGLIHSNKSTGVRRMSHEQVVNKSSSGSSQTQLPSLANIPSNIKSILSSQLDWEFDIFELENLTNKSPLVWSGLSIFHTFNICSTLNCDEKTLLNWLTLVESYYRPNPYHNSTHAADVMQATAYFLRKPKFKSIFDSLDEAICLISAVVHDIDHPGKNSAFLCNSNNELAILYNDISVLESHHAALAFKLTIGEDSVNIFKNLDPETYREVRQSIIDMVLATEMTKHFEHLSKFVNAFTSPIKIDENEDKSFDKSIESTDAANPENVVLIKRMLIKCADVSNPVRPLNLCKIWANRIAEEYCDQTDEEKSKGLPVVMPAFDRATCSIPKSQIGFIDYFSNDMFEAWDAFGDFPELIQNLKSNYLYWKDLEKEHEKTKL